MGNFEAWINKWFHSFCCCGCGFLSFFKKDLIRKKILFLFPSLDSIFIIFPYSLANRRRLFPPCLGGWPQASKQGCASYCVWLTLATSSCQSQGAQAKNKEREKCFFFSSLFLYALIEIFQVIGSLENFEADQKIQLWICNHLFIKVSGSRDLSWTIRRLIMVMIDGRDWSPSPGQNATILCSRSGWPGGSGGFVFAEWIRNWLVGRFLRGPFNWPASERARWPRMSNRGQTSTCIKQHMPSITDWWPKVCPAPANVQPPGLMTDDET